VNGLSTLPAPTISSPAVELLDAVARGRDGLLRRQRTDGHWVGELQGDSILESEYILLMAFLGREKDDRVGQAANYLLEVQNEEGGWGNYPGGPAEISTTVKAYFALKIAGHSPDCDYLKRAAAVVHRLGGAEACNSFTKFYLALLGQIPFASCAAVPPEIVLLPRWFYFNIYALSAWSRTILVPLSIVWAHKPVRTLPPEMAIRELFLADPTTPRPPHPWARGWFRWTNIFLRVDRWIKRFERWRLTPFRRWAVRKATRWMRERYVDSDGVGAIFPPMVYNAIALRCLGVPDDDPEMIWAMKQIEDLMIPEGDTLRLQPCFSPVWDTALSLIAVADSSDCGLRIADCGLKVNGNGASRESVFKSEIRNPKSEIRNAIDWLLAREVRRPGDWSVANSKQEPGGWFFEYRNGFYPDVDDTAMVLIALARTGDAKSPEAAPPVARGLSWLLSMQNRDGGWAAFDRNINRKILEKVPFADHNAMLDPSCPDITARVLEALGHFGHRPGKPLVDGALAFIEKNQTPDGKWPGRWGVNYIYGTWQVLVGLRQIGHDMHSPMVRKAVEWLKSVQQEKGAWGESCRSYDDPSWAGRGEPTASQTAWALLGLLAAGEGDSDEVRAGIDWLLATQKDDGSWEEELFTGTGFPKVFYLKYHLYSVYFPLMALARYTKIGC
jgi:squalene-hopene/tetraprenyl-beta-curcumene cyclase